MILLFSPSETKLEGGVHDFDSSTLFGAHLQQREPLLEIYEEFVSTTSYDLLENFFETGDPHKRDLYSTPLHTRKTMKAVKRYDGVAYDYLKYSSLEQNEQHFIDTSMIIFSNLFGPIRAADMICDYRFRQGAKIPNVAWEKLYKMNFSPFLDQICQGKMVVDLRAGFYEKFYQPQGEKVSFIFKKGGKIVSHWAKAYRGETARLLAIHQPTNIDEIIALPWENKKSVSVENTPNNTIITVSI